MDGLEYVWVEGQPDFIRAFIEKMPGGGDNRVLLPPGKRMTVGFRQAANAQHFEFSTTGDGTAALYSGLGLLIEQTAGDSFDAAGGWVAVARASS